MELQDLFSRLAVALGIGLLVGLERGWRQREDAPGTRTAGIRTFGLIGLLGGVLGALAQAGGIGSPGGGLVLAAGFAVFAAVFAVFCRDENRADKVYSATMAVAGMVTFALGAYALIGDLRVAGAAAVATVAVLASREVLHGWIGGITWLELRAALVLLAMTFIALPLMPDDPVGPFGGVNLREVWLIAIVLAGVSLLGYLAVKYFGATRGVLLAAAAGGLVSSTAVMAANARRAAAGEGAPGLLAAGALLASAVSLLRVAGVLAALNASLLAIAAPPLLAGAAVMAATAGLAVLRTRRAGETSSIELRNPFELKSVVLFALLLGVLVVVGRVLSEKFGTAGALAAAIATGLADVDAITVSMARLTPSPLSSTQAVLAILAAVMSNTLTKLVLGVVVGRGIFALWLMASTAAALLAGAGGMLLALAFHGSS